MDYGLLVASSASQVSLLEAAGNGHWSQWLDVDASPDWGTGEYENTRRIRYQQDNDQQCYVGCEEPLAMRYSVVDAHTPATWTDIGESTAPSGTKVAFSLRRLRRVTAVKGRITPSTAVDRDRTCANAGTVSKIDGVLLSSTA